MPISKTNFTLTRSLAMNNDETGGIIGIQGYLIGKIIRLKQDTRVYIGRDESQCDIIVLGDRVSRVHCVISYSNGGYTICDMSSNGILVNNKYMLEKNKETRLRSGTTLCIGSTENIIKLG